LKRRKNYFSFLGEKESEFLGATVREGGGTCGSNTIIMDLLVAIDSMCTEQGNFQREVLFLIGRMLQHPDI
jgi:hypothetical protein